MPLRTQLFQLLPWIGGTNTALDPSVIPANMLLQAYNVVFGSQGSRKKRDSINFNWDDTTTGSVSFLAGHDYWFVSGGAKTSKQVTVGSDKSYYAYTKGGTGTHSVLTDSGTAWASSITTACIETLNNLCIIGADGSGNVVKKWSGSGNIVDFGYYTGIAATTTSGSNIVAVSGNLAGTALGSTVTGTNIPAATTVLAIYGSNLIISNNASGTGATTLTFQNSIPQGAFFREHLGRLWMNDKTNPDRLHYSSTGLIEEMNGYGDSGVIDIGVGDGDPVGITAIFPTFDGVLFVAKKTKLYKISGLIPEEFSVSLVSDGIGCVSHNAVCAVDQDDIFFISEKGVHSLSATSQYGDFESKYVSFDIQPTFNTLWDASRLTNSWGVYLSDINSVAFAVTDTTFGSGSNNAIWLFNIPQKAWYVWPSLSCQSMWLVRDSDKRRFYLGTNTSRVAKGYYGTNYDVSTSGTNSDIAFKVKTGQLLVDENQYTVKGYKRFILMYRPSGIHTITVTVQIDNYPAQSLSFSQTSGGDLLGSTFILGTSLLGYSSLMASYAQTIDGFGHAIQVTIEQTGVDEQIEIQGIGIEWEGAGTAQETIQS